VAIGGLTDTSDSTAVTKIPFLGDIPIIGKYLFSHESTSKSQIETIILVTLSLASPETLDRSPAYRGLKLVHKRLIRDQTDNRNSSAVSRSCRRRPRPRKRPMPGKRLPKTRSDRRPPMKGFSKETLSYAVLLVILFASPRWPLSTL